MENGGGNKGKVWELLCFVDEVQRVYDVSKLLFMALKELME